MLTFARPLGQLVTRPIPIHSISRTERLVQFSIRFLMLICVVAAGFSFFAANRTRTAFALTCLLLPVAIGLFVRYSWTSNNGLASVIVFVTAIFVGSLLMAYGSYHKTFLEGAKGFLVGDGWSSVGASSIVGGVAGAVCGLFSILVYSIVVSIVRISTSANSR
jgi:hypothetical protein